MYRRTYDGFGFSPLRQITASSIPKLSLAWSLNMDLVEAHEMPYDNITNKHFDSGDYPEAVRRAIAVLAGLGALAGWRILRLRRR